MKLKLYAIKHENLCKYKNNTKKNSNLNLNVTDFIQRNDENPIKYQFPSPITDKHYHTTNDRAICAEIPICGSQQKSISQF